MDAPALKQPTFGRCRPRKARVLSGGTEEGNGYVCIVFAVPCLTATHVDEMYGKWEVAAQGLSTQSRGTAQGLTPYSAGIHLCHVMPLKPPIKRTAVSLGVALQQSCAEKHNSPQNRECAYAHFPLRNLQVRTLVDAPPDLLQ